MFNANEKGTEPARSANNALEYLNQAQCEQQKGNDSLATSLYLAAFDCAQKEGAAEDDMFIDGLKQAWFLAAAGKQRTLAEHIFGLMEPYLSQKEVEQYVRRLQDLAFERLEEFGVERGDIENVLSSIPSEMLEAGFPDIEEFIESYLDDDEYYECEDDDCGDCCGGACDDGRGDCCADACDDDCGDCCAGACDDDYGDCCAGACDDDYGDCCAGACDDGRDNKGASYVDGTTSGEAGAQNAEGENASRHAAARAKLQVTPHAKPQDASGASSGAAQKEHTTSVQPSKASAAGTPAQTPGMPQLPDVFPFLSQMLQNGHGTIAAFGIPTPGQKVAAPERLNYRDMAGFERTVEQMRALGIGFESDPELKQFMKFLNEQHGLSGIPVADTIIFRAAAREDASHFMEATLGELKLPGVRIQVDENIHGELVLCVMAQASMGLRLNTMKGEIEGSGVLILEDVDLWGEFLPCDEDDDCAECAARFGGHNVSASKGAREAMRLIRSAVENPNVYVLASCASDAQLSDAFLDILEPFELVDIELPNNDERAHLWKDLMSEHPSMKGANLDTLVKNSKGLARFDIYLAAREAVEASYKESLASKKYQPLTTALLCEKLAAYQPLDSDEYKSLEEQVVSDFRLELENLDAYLGLDKNDTGPGNTLGNTLGNTEPSAW